MSQTPKDPIWTAAAIGDAEEPDTLGQTLRPPVSDRDSVTRELGGTVGPWTLRRVLGRGGMGAVYLAERSGQDFHQRAALKLIKLGMDSGEITQRFLAERRILARLEHPNIARLIDGGVDAQGRPYFVMEWIDGLPLIEYASGANLGLEARLQLFLKLCDAVAYAHRQLVVHRDLKPGNVLVDTRGEPKLLDFGIAKLLQTDDPHHTSATGARFYTRAYAAPEQIRGEPVTTATDVYALGAVLFELLTGSSLHSARALRQDTRELLSEARRRSGAEGPAAIAPRALSGDLALIVAKAVRDEPSRRYPGAETLAEDLRAYLEGRPVRARPDAFGYRLSRFLRRHWLATLVSAGALAAILGAATIAFWQARLAREEALRAEMVSSFLASVFESATPQAEAQGDITAASLLERGAERIERELAGQPKVQSRLYGTLARAYFYLGDYSRAAELYEAGRARVDAADARTASDLLRGLAQTELAAGQLSLARTHVDQAVAIWQQSGERDDLQLARIRSVEKSLLGAEGHLDQARDLAFGVHLDLARILGADHEETLLALNDYGTWVMEAGAPEQALPIFEQVIAARRRVSGPDHPEIGAALHNLQLCLLRLGRLPEARLRAEEALTLRRRILPPKHRDLARSMAALAVIEVSSGRAQQALTLRSEAIEVLRAQRRPDLLQLGVELSNASVDAYQLGQLPLAQRFVDESIEVYAKILPVDDARRLRAESYRGLISLHRGDLPGAEQMLRTVVTREASAGVSASSRLSSLRYLARALRWQGRAQEALELLEGEPAASLLGAISLSANDRARTEIEAALVLIDLENWSAAEQCLDAAAQAYGTIDMAADSDHGQWLLARSQVLAGQQNWRAAFADADKATQLLLKARGPQHWDTLEARMITAEARWRRHPDAASRKALDAALRDFAAVRPWHPEIRRLRPA